jgi:spoIIIJ-associated protein
MFERELEKVIREILEKTPFSVDSIEVDVASDETNIWCKISSEDSRHLIGRNGETLQSIDYLVKRILEKRLRENDIPYTNFILDINNYQKKKVDAIRSRAHMLAERARYFKSKVEAPPMTAFERKIVHDHLSREDDISTESTGEGRERRVVVSFTLN